MVKILVSLVMGSILLYVLTSTWQSRSKVIPFDPKTYQEQIPQASAQEQSLALFGEQLFHDKRFSSDQTVACSSCHKPEFSFADNSRQSKGIGLTKVNSLPLINLGWKNSFFWDGRADNLVDQAIQPLLNPSEHNFTPEKAVALVVKFYRSQYESNFTAMDPNLIERVMLGKDLDKDYSPSVQEILINISQALAQFSKGLVAIDSPFDRFIKGYTDSENLTFVEGFTEKEWHGFQIFIGKAKCTECHSGAMLTDNKFYFTGLADEVFASRDQGVRSLSKSPLRCFGLSQCPDLPDPENPLLQGQVRTPSLRNLTMTAPYFHDGSASTVREVIYRYMRPKFSPRSSKKIESLYLNATEVDDLELFLRSLDSPIYNIYTNTRYDVAKAH